MIVQRILGFDSCFFLFGFLFFLFIFLFICLDWGLSVPDEDDENVTFRAPFYEAGCVLWIITGWKWGNRKHNNRFIMGTQNIIITNHNNKIIITKQHINKTSYWEGVTHVFEEFVCPPKSANMFPQEKIRKCWWNIFGGQTQFFSFKFSFGWLINSMCKGPQEYWPTFRYWPVRSQLADDDLDWRWSFNLLRKHWREKTIFYFHCKSFSFHWEPRRSHLESKYCILLLLFLLQLPLMQEQGGLLWDHWHVRLPDLHAHLPLPVDLVHAPVLLLVQHLLLTVRCEVFELLVIPPVTSWVFLRYRSGEKAPPDHSNQVAGHHIDVPIHLGQGAWDEQQRGEDFPVNWRAPVFSRACNMCYSSEGSPRSGFFLGVQNLHIFRQTAI